MPVTTVASGRAGVYERFVDPEHAHEIWRHRGQGITLAGKGLIQLADPVQTAQLANVKGVYGHFEGICCGPEPSADYECLVVTVEPAEVDVKNLARTIAEIFSRAEHADYDVIIYHEGLAH